MDLIVLHIRVGSASCRAAIGAARQHNSPGGSGGDVDAWSGMHSSGCLKLPDNDFNLTG